MKKIILGHSPRETRTGGFVRFMGRALSSIARSMRFVPIMHHGAESSRRFLKFNITSTFHYLKKLDCKFRSISLRILPFCLVSFFLAPGIAFAGGVTIITHGRMGIIVTLKVGSLI